MPKALLHCFSGTGNTRLTADLLAAGLTGSGYKTTLRFVEDGLYSGGENVDLHIFLFPVYATSVPHIMAKYLAHLPDGKAARAAVLSTNGRVSTRIRDGYQGWALHQARLLLKLRHYDVHYSDTFDLPHNVTAFGPPRQDKFNRKIVGNAVPAIRKASERIAAGERRHRRCFPLNFLWSVPFGLLYSWIGRHAVGKLLAADHRCTGCGLCVKSCPARNIAMRGKRPRFGWRCEGCLRCVNRCPRPSIQLSAARLAAMVFACLWNPLLIYGVYRPGFLNGALGGFLGGAAEILLYFVVSLTVFFILDMALYLLGYVPGARQILGWGHSALYGRYDSGKFTKDIGT